MALATDSAIDSIKKAVKETNLQHIAIIMDGNRRWARKRGLTSIFGHKEGVKAFKRTVKACSDSGIKYLTVYAFSTENWGRQKDEVEFLMRLLGEVVTNELDELHENNVKVSIIGDNEGLEDRLIKLFNQIEGKTKENTGLNLQIAINYGSRNEITNAIRRIAADVKAGIIDSPDRIDTALVSDYLYTAGIPDPDLLIRTGGELRISNYLLWQIAYTEIYVTETFWPDFDEKALEQSVQSFAARHRRFGKD
ncbi:MAG: isoprenyl transferase [Candidatus Gastranaerophilales bacterium]|nr:isoprenyl transferase [Candidatus Gastranaerophilales bacterium]